MNSRLIAKACAAALACLILWPDAAAGQSAISGLVTDESNSVLPGVTVEASSTVLIEKVRAVVTDDKGRYNIVDLRPGVYKVTFTLPGFSTLVRENIELGANFVATVNADMKIGTLQETVTVTSESPIVDVQSTQRVVDLRRDLLDALPTSRTYAAEGSLSVGVRVNGQNVGGARTSTQQRMMVHGAAAADNTISVDGMKMNTLTGDGVTIPQHNDSMTQEVTVQTASPGAEVSGGGLYLNLIPKEGGNIYSGSNFFGYTANSFQGDNLTDDLKARGVTSGDAVDHIYDLNASVGGPIVRDKLWFFGSFRDIGNGNIVANSFYADGRPGINDQTVKNMTARLTSQLSSRNKVTAYMDRAYKNVFHSFSAGQDPATASVRWPPILYYTAAAKWTATVTNKLFFELGVGAVANNYAYRYQEGIHQDRGTPAWYATAARQDIALSTLTTAATREEFHYPMLQMLQSSASYVTGSHSFKAGLQVRQGTFKQGYDANADLIQRYRNGIPDSVSVYNTPVRSFDRMNADVGTFAQDSWTVKRMTVNAGMRFEYVNSKVEATSVEAGRFVGARSFPEVPNLPNWFNVAPRFGVVYDLTGDAKTALRASVNKYNISQATTFAERYDPASFASDVRNWSDCDYLPGTSTCSPLVLPTNRDGIAQNNEIGPSNNALFGVASTRRPDPDIKRTYNVEYSAGVDRQLFSGVSVSGSWYRRTWHNLPTQINTLVNYSDYTPFQTPNPLTGEPMTVYNLNPAKQGQVDLIDTTSQDPSKSRQMYTGVDLTFQARLPNTARLFGGWTADRMTVVACDGVDPNTLLNCDQSLFHIPFRSDFKLVGTTPIGLGVSLGVVIQSYAGAPVGCAGSVSGGTCQSTVTYVVPAAAYPGGRRTQSTTMNLLTPGSEYLARWNQVDLSVRRIFKIKRVRLDGSLDVFNLFNSNSVLNEVNSFGATLYQPTQILQPRLLRLSSTLNF